MKTIKYPVALSIEEQKKLESMVRRGKHNASVLNRARILLQLHKGTPDQTIVSVLDVGKVTIWRLKKIYVAQGLTAALREKVTKKGPPKTLDGQAEAQLIQLACSSPPEGRSRWTVRLLGRHVVDLGIVESVGKSTIHKTLKKTNLRLIGKNSGSSLKKRTPPL